MYKCTPSSYFARASRRSATLAKRPETTDSEVEMLRVIRSEQEPYCVLLQTDFFKQEVSTCGAAATSSSSTIEASFQGRTRVLQLRAVRVPGKRFFIPVGTELKAHIRPHQGIFVAAGAFLGEEQTAKAAAGQVLKGPCAMNGSGSFVLCFVGRENTKTVANMRGIPIILSSFTDPVTHVEMQFARLVSPTTTSDAAVLVAEVLAVDFGKYVVVENAVVDPAVSTAAAEGAEQLACMFELQRAATAGALSQRLDPAVLAGSDSLNHESSSMTSTPVPRQAPTPFAHVETPHGNQIIGNVLDENRDPRSSVESRGKAVGAGSVGSGSTRAKATPAALKARAQRRSSSQGKNAAPRLEPGSAVTPTAASNDSSIPELDKLRLRFVLRTALEELTESQNKMRAAFGCKGWTERERAAVASALKMAAKAGAKEATITVKNDVHLGEAKLARAFNAALRFVEPAPTRKRARNSGGSAAASLEDDEPTNIINVIAAASAEATTAAVKSAFRAQEEAAVVAAATAAAAAAAPAAQRPLHEEDQQRATKVQQQALASIEEKVAALSADVATVKDFVRDAETRIMNCMQMMFTAMSQVKQEPAQQTAASAQALMALASGAATQPHAQMAQQMQAWVASHAPPAQAAAAMLRPAAAAAPNPEEMQMLAAYRQMMGNSSGQGRMQAQPPQTPMQGFNFTFPAGRFT